MVNKLGLRQEVDSRLHLLKKHLPYHESDHVLNLTYNALLDQGLSQKAPGLLSPNPLPHRVGYLHEVEDIVLLKAAGKVPAGGRVWNALRSQPIDTDGTMAPTLGECKGGMALSYKGIWGYAPLVVSLANTNEVLYLVNRPGNVVSHEGCVPWIDRAIQLLAPHAGQISVQQGERALFDEIRYSFYITNRLDYTGEQIVSLANGRCHQENVIEQFKNGVNAMRMPVDDLLSNWAYMVMSSLAWNLKAWFGLLLPNGQRGVELIKMEFRRFLHAIVLLPAQIVRTGRRVIYRIMSYNRRLKDLFAAWEHLRWLRAT